MRVFVERPIGTVMMFMILSILGIHSIFNIPVELAPKEDYPRLNIITHWPGVSPEVIQTQLTSPLEEISSVVQGVRKITSTSRVGSSLITLDFDASTNMQLAELALREQIARIRGELPSGVKPIIQLFIPEDFRVEHFLNYTISGSYPLQELRELTKTRIEYALRSVKGVARVEVTGGADPEIKIIVNRNKAKALNVHSYQISNSIRQSILAFPAGRAKKGNQEYIFRISKAIQKFSDFGELVISHSGDNPIKLKDLAQIVFSFGEVERINRINGKPAVMLNVAKEKGTNTLKVAKRIKEKFELVRRDLPKDLIIKVVDDESEDIQGCLEQLYLLGGIILMVIFTIIFSMLRSIKPSLLILCSIVFSILITFNFIYIFNISIDLLTLGGLALGFGLFVDNSIVVFENVLRSRERGLPPIQAAIQGSREVFLPLLASTLTTVSVFFSFAYFQGRLKIYYLPLAMVISSALAASLLVSFSLIPALSAKLLKGERRKNKKRFREFFEKFLKFSIGNPLETLLIITLVFYGSYRWFKGKVPVGEFFNWHFRQRLMVKITMAPGTEIKMTDAIVKKFEERVLEKNYEKEIKANVFPESAYLDIAFPPQIENSYCPYLLKDELIQLAAQFAGIGISIWGFDTQGYSSELGGIIYNSRIKFLGYNLKKLNEITSDIQSSLKRNSRIKEVCIVTSRGGYWRADSFEYILKLDKEAMGEYNINPDCVFDHLQSSCTGNYYRMKAMIGGKETDLSLKFDKADEMDLTNLQDVLLRTKGGEHLKLKEISTLEERPIAGSIDRENQQFQQTVSWEFRGPRRMAEDHRKAVFSGLRLPPGFSAVLEEESRLTEAEKSKITFAIIFSLIVIFMILASLYESLIQPFFILLAVPLALIGVFIAFVIADFPFDSSAYIGVLLLGGIAVNNSILLVNHIHLKRKQGLSPLEAILEGTNERVRPIFMTTGTTVLGMLPMVLIQVEEGRKGIWQSLALSTVGGLISSTIFILIVIPIIYFHGEKIRLWTYVKIEELRKAWKSFR